MLLHDLTMLARKLPNVEVTSVTADSRNVKPGALFAALPGSVVDGRRYIPQAIEAGAVAILAVPGTAAVVPVIESEEPRLSLAQIAMRFHPGQPSTVAGITGTNGKTSVARFTQQLWSRLGHSAGTLGTLGAFAPGYEYALRHTTPDPVEVHQILSTMASMGTTHLAMEVSSHGLSQYRADGVQFKVAAFTNITQDHLDYHPDFEHYFEAKQRLLTELLDRDGTAVVNIDGPGAERAVEAAEAAGRRVMTVGRKGRDLKLAGLLATPGGLTATIEAANTTFEVELDLVGSFQADNALVAAGLVIASGYSVEQVIPQLAHITPAPGRMQKVGVRQFESAPDASIYVDYAHTPDAIATALAAIKPHAVGDVHILFGAGGERDKSKRPLMAEAAAKAARKIIVTDDNPRSEDPAVIRRDVIAGAPEAIEIGDRREAIFAAVKALGPGETLLIAGKGHEQGQTIAGVTYPFDDVAVATEALAQEMA